MKLEKKLEKLKQERKYFMNKEINETE